MERIKQKVHQTFSTMKYSYFKSIAGWAGNKFAEKLGGNGKAWNELFFLPHFKEGFKNHSRIYFLGDISLANTRDILPKHYLGHGTYKFESMISWSFETKDFKPTDQLNAEILVFRFKAVKSQKSPTLRVIHYLKK